MTQPAPRRIDPEGFTRAAHFSQAVFAPAGMDLLFVSGQVAGDGFDQITADDVATQAQRAFDRIEAILAAGGMGPADVVKVNGFIADRSFVAAYRKVFLERLGAVRPTSTLVVAELIDPRLLVEIEVVAARPPRASDPA